LLALVTVAILIFIEIISYYLIIHRLKSRNLDLKQETSTGSLIVNSENQGKIIAILNAQPRKKKLVIRLALFLQVGTFLFFVPQVWSFLDFIPYIDATGEITPFEGTMAFYLIITSMIYGLGLIPFYYVIETQFRSPIITSEGVANRSPWSRKFFLHWGEINNIRFTSWTGNEFLLESDEGNIRINCLLTNLDIFSRILMEKVPKKKWANVEKFLKQALKGPFY